MMRVSQILAVAALAFAAGLCGVGVVQAQPQPSAQAAEATTYALGIGEATTSGYVLGRDDVVAVSLLGRNDFGGRARVQADGMIQLPLIGKVVASERTTAELAETVRKALQTGGFYADPVVDVEVVAFASRYITVLGAVGAPGLMPMNRPYRLSEVLAKVGGVRDGAADYVQVRSADGAEKKYIIRDLATGDNSQDPYVKAGDKIYVPAGEIFYIYGQVRAPGVLPLAADMTVKQALAKAGGLTESGSDKKVVITRGGKKVTVNSEAKIQAGDVLFISERLF